MGDSAHWEIRTTRRFQAWCAQLRVEDTDKTRALPSDAAMMEVKKISHRATVTQSPGRHTQRILLSVTQCLRENHHPPPRSTKEIGPPQDVWAISPLAESYHTSFQARRAEPNVEDSDIAGALLSDAAMMDIKKISHRATGAQRPGRHTQRITPSVTQCLRENHHPPATNHQGNEDSARSEGYSAHWESRTTRRFKARRAEPNVEDSDIAGALLSDAAMMDIKKISHRATGAQRPGRHTQRITPSVTQCLRENHHPPATNHQGNEDSARSEGYSAHWESRTTRRFKARRAEPNVEDTDKTRALPSDAAIMDIKKISHRATESQSSGRHTQRITPSVSPCLRENHPPPPIAAGGSTCDLSH